MTRFDYFIQIVINDKVVYMPKKFFFRLFSRAIHSVLTPRLLTL